MIGQLKIGLLSLQAALVILINFVFFKMLLSSKTSSKTLHCDYEFHYLITSAVSEMVILTYIKIHIVYI